jgi:hypothetical protein
LVTLGAQIHRRDQSIADPQRVVAKVLGRGTGGRPYVINDRDLVTCREFVAGLAEVEGLSINGLRSVPFRVAFALGRLMEAVAGMRSEKGDPPLTRTLVRFIGREFTTNDAAARRELSYIGPTSRSEGLGRMGAGVAPHGQS